MLRLCAALCAALVLCAAAVRPPRTPRHAYVFTIPPVDQVLDLHGNPADAQLAVFMSGNQYMVMPALLGAFRRLHPEFRDIYYETLPPGIVARQIAAGALRVGNLEIDPQPDVFMAGSRRMRMMERDGYVADAFPYASNVLAIMVRKPNTKHVASIRDLANPKVRIAMPNPLWEGIAEQIEAAYRKAGGDALVDEIMRTKVASGTTILTQIHHRQTPLFIREGRVDAGPVWISEALFQARIGAPVSVVRIPEADNVTAQYMAAIMRNAPHPRAAQAFLAFLKTPEARRIFLSYGFGPPR